MIGLPFPPSLGQPALLATAPRGRYHAYIIHIILAPTVSAASQCGTGNPTCPCVSSFAGFNVSNFDATSGGLVVTIEEEAYSYGVSYGLHACGAHDRETPPYCNVPGAPSWCSMLWCYVDASSCSLSNAPSSYLTDAVGLHYSYETCDSEDTFTTSFTQRDGVVRLCSVFAEDGDSDAPCGATSTHVQVEAMVRALNSLNGGRGFEMQTGLLSRHYTFNYSYATYPAGEWDAVGRRLSEDTFQGACDVVVGMASGCPDADIVAQALVANATSRIYLTGRGPRAVLVAGGTRQPYLFSTHVRSDKYADASLLRLARLGARSVALLYETDSDEAGGGGGVGANSTGDYFYRGLGERIVEYASDLQLELTHVSMVRRAADGTADLAALEAQVLEAHATRADVLMLVVRSAEFSHALDVLKAARPPAEGGHVYRALWWQGVPWGAFDCAGLAHECEYAVGATQMGAAEGASGHVDAVLGMTYEQMLQAFGSDASGDGASGGLVNASVNATAAVGLPDGAMIPSTIAQAMTTLFRFREVSSPALPLADALDYELLRSFLRSGDVLAHTFYGPVRFNGVGQNEGKQPTTLQMRGGVARVVLPAELQQDHVFLYPAPAADCPADAARVRYDAADDCLLCAATTCVTSPASAAVLAGVLAGAGLVLLAAVLGAALFCKRSRTRRLLLRATGKPPRLKLPPSCAFHLFLSHTWASGQDQVARIKHGLRTCLPTAVVFLDVDDLEDIGALEEYVSQTAVTLMFLSRGYFKSINCLREVRAWADTREGDAAPGGGGGVDGPPRGLILVHETAPNHGGIPIAQLRDECPPTLVPLVFSERHMEALVPFYRHERIWQAALKQIAAYVIGYSAYTTEVVRELRTTSREPSRKSALRASQRSSTVTLERSSVRKARRKVELPSLYFASEPGYRGDGFELALESQTVLAVSPHNQGAAALANELKASVANLAVLEMGDGGDDDATEAALAQSTHMLLLLNRHVFANDEDGPRLARVLRTALRLPQLAAQPSSEPSPSSDAGGRLAGLARLREAVKKVQAQRHLVQATEPTRVKRRASLAALGGDTQRSSTALLAHRLSAGFREENTTTAQANSLAGALGEGVTNLFQRAGEGVSSLINQVGGESGEPRKAKLLLVHAVDEADGGCAFDDFFTMTPPDLLQMGQIFRTPAVPLFRAPQFRAISLELAAEALGPLRRARRARRARSSHESLRDVSRRLSLGRSSTLARDGAAAAPAAAVAAAEASKTLGEEASVAEWSVSVTWRSKRPSCAFHEAAVQVQRVYRGTVARRALHVEKMQRAATTVQRIIRGLGVRQALARAACANAAVEREVPPAAPSAAPPAAPSSDRGALEVTASCLLAVDARAVRGPGSPPTRPQVGAFTSNAAALERARSRPKMPRPTRLSVASPQVEDSPVGALHV